MREMTEEEQALAYRFADVALPAEAIDCDPWCWHGEQDWRRYFVVREWEIAGIWVSVGGEQNHLGHVTRWMHVGGEDQCSTSERTQLIVAVTEAGELLDMLNSVESFRADSTTDWSSIEVDADGQRDDAR